MLNARLRMMTAAGWRTLADERGTQCGRRELMSLEVWLWMAAEGSYYEQIVGPITSNAQAQWQEALQAAG